MDAGKRLRVTGFDETELITDSIRYVIEVILKRCPYVQTTLDAEF